MIGPLTAETIRVVRRLGYEVMLVPDPAYPLGPPRGEAFVCDKHRRYINLFGDFASDAVVAFVIWHEVGHHIQVPGLIAWSTIPHWRSELTCDRYALDMLRGSVDEGTYGLLESLAREHVRPQVQALIDRLDYGIHKLDLKTCEWLGCTIPLDARYMMLRDPEMTEIHALYATQDDVDWEKELDDECPF